MAERRDDDTEVYMPAPLPGPQAWTGNEGAQPLPEERGFPRVQVQRMPVHQRDFLYYGHQVREEQQQIDRYPPIDYQHYPVLAPGPFVDHAAPQETVIQLTQKQETEMAVRTTKLTNKQAECAAVLQQFVGTGPKVVATDSDAKSKQLHALLRALAEQDRPTKGLILPEKYVGCRELADLSNWAFAAQQVKPVRGLDAGMLERLAGEYAWFCNAWDFEPSTEKMKYFGGDGIVVQTPEVRIPMPAPYPKGYMSCGQIRIRIGIGGGTSWGIEPAGFGPIAKPVKYTDTRSHPHDMTHYYCTGGWETALNRKAEKYDLIGFLDILWEMLTMETSKKRFYDGYGKTFEYAYTKHCHQCGTFQYDGNAPRAGFGAGRELCRGCGGKVICAICAKTRRVGHTYSAKLCTACTWASELPPWWEKAPPPDVTAIPCARCGTIAKTRNHRVPVKNAKKVNEWVCTSCLAPDGSDTAVCYASMTTGKGEDE